MRLFLALILFTQSVYGAAIWPNGSRLQTFQNGFLFGNGQTIDSAASGFTFGNGAQFNGPFTLQQQSTPSNPSAGFNKLYFKSDDNLYRLNSAGSELPVNGIDLGGQNQSNLTASTIKVPNRQSTSIASGQSLIETGNKNLLANPSFEHSTVSSSWTVVTGTTAAETTIIQDGLRSISLTRPTSGPTALSQSVNTSFISGQQGFMSCRVRTNQPSMRICPVVDGVTQTSICSTIAPSSSYFNYRTAFLFGASTSGLIVESTANGTGITYVDDCTLQLAQPSDFIDMAQVGPWISYTPTTEGFGTITTIGTRYRIVGSSIEIQGKFTTGTVAASQARLFLPSGFTVSSTATGYFQVGRALRFAGASAYEKDLSLLTENGLTYVGFGVTGDSGTGDPSVLQNGNGIAGNSNPITFFASIPVQGLSNKITTYSQFAVSDVSVENVFSAQVQGTASPSPVFGESLDWINGSCTRTGTGIYDCPINSGVFTVLPSCTGSRIASTGAGSLSVTYDRAASTTSNLRFLFTDTAGTPFNSDFTIICTKQGADYKAKNVITGSFQGIEKCADPYECTDTFSLYSSGGTVSQENIDWINGNASVSGSQFTFTPVSGVFTVAPNCTAVTQTNVNIAARVETATTATSIVVTTYNTATGATGVGASVPFYLKCQKQGVDFRPKTAVAGTFLDSVTSPGAGKVSMCSAKISSTGVISDQIGGCFASCTNATTPVCTFTASYWVSGSVPNCWHRGDVGVLGNTNRDATTMSGVLFNSSGTVIGGARDYFCHGTRP